MHPTLPSSPLQVFAAGTARTRRDAFVDFQQIFLVQIIISV
jgi:hypothetical protein